MIKKNIFRVIDANLNRVSEGLRVCEDILRFIFEDAVLTKRIKDFRHEIFKIISDYPLFPQRVEKYRCSDEDKTKYANLHTEFRRAGITNILKANFKRIQQGLRVLEEILKIDYQDLSKQLKKLRFNVYEVEKKIYNTIDRNSVGNDLDLTLYQILDLDLYPDNILDRTNKIIDAGISVLQLRSKKKSDKDFFHIAKKIKKITFNKKVVLLINDRIDLSIAVEADGVHLGQEDLPVSVVRRLIGYDKIIGISTHSIEEIKEAIEKEVNYISFGPIFKTTTKPELKPVGAEILDNINFEMNKSLIAIGGINGSNIKKLYDKKLSGIAVASAVLSDKNIDNVVKDLKKKVINL